MSVNQSLLSEADKRAMRTIVTMLGNLRVGALTVELPDGRHRIFGDATSELRATLQVHDWAFFRRLLTGG